MRRSLLVVLLATMMVMASAGAAFAGEATGPSGNPDGADTDQNQGKSWCSFSGLNDDPEGTADPSQGPGGISQSYGQELKLDLVDPVGDKFGHPGIACNPHRTFLPPNPNRTVNGP
jgi:hypothetical protein